MILPMSEPRLLLQIDPDDVDELRSAVHDAEGELEITVGADAARAEGAAARQLASAIAELAVVIVSGAGLARAIAPVLIARIQATRKGVRVVRPDGSSVEIDGAYDVKEVETILAASVADPDPS